MSDERDIDVVHTIFIIDILQLCGNVATDLAVAVTDDRAESADWLKQRVNSLAVDLYKRSNQIRNDASLNFKEALAARQKLRAQESGQA